MLTPFSRALAYYLIGGFALALLCALWLFDDPDASTSPNPVTRRALMCSALGVFHPVIALSAYALARDVRDAEIDDRLARSPRIAALTSVAVSTAAMIGVLITTADM